jgi:hypothetical protein
VDHVPVRWKIDRVAFPKVVVDQVLAETGRMCAVCNKQNKVQVHHIEPKERGGPDSYENAIPLCPNCHDEVHSEFAPGRVTRLFSEGELRRHLARTKLLATQQAAVRPGNGLWRADVERLRFFRGVLDRPALRHHFHNELSFSDFDQALEDTVLAINTGYWRTRDGALIERGEGKSHLINVEWRSALDDAVRIIGTVREALRQALGLDDLLYRLGSGDRELFRRSEALQWDGPVARRIDDLRNELIDVVNAVLLDAGLHELLRIGA